MAMKKLVKTALCLLLCAFLSLPALAEVAAASKTLTNGAYVTSGDYTYTLLKDGSARIIDYTGDAEALTVPAELDGHLVRQIGDRAFSACFSLTSVRLPKGLTAIGEDAFQRCESLASIALPEGLTAIGDNAFFSCGLASIALPDSLTSIGEGAFDGCSDTLTLTVPRDSYACQYAIDNGIPYTCSDANG